MQFINRVEPGLQKGIQGIELGAKISVEPELQVLLGAGCQVCLLQLSLGRCDFTVQYMSVYSVTCSELLVINSHFIWHMTSLPPAWRTHSNLIGKALLKSEPVCQAVSSPEAI